mmetsp:Transcript_40849/g.115539  ORF Transcript_40849/g.115539 Transcript_40849/m.115539 type:complete len:288 (+) Transcript_40849:247-1110(+)
MIAHGAVQNRRQAGDAGAARLRRSMPESSEVEITRRLLELGCVRILSPEQLSRGLNLCGVRRLVLASSPEASAIASCQLVQGHLLRRPAVRVGAIARARRNRARPMPGKSVPHAAGIVGWFRRIWVHGGEVVAANKVAVARIHNGAIAWPGASFVVVGVPHTEVHAFGEQGGWRLVLDLVPHNPRETGLRPPLREDLALQIPHEARQVPGVNALQDAAHVAFRPVDMEDEELAVARTRRCRNWRYGARFWATSFEVVRAADARARAARPAAAELAHGVGLLAAVLPT